MMKKTAFALLCSGILAPIFCLGDDYGVSAEQAAGLLEEKRAQILFIDVRDPVEIMFTGATNMVDANIPYLLVDRFRWNPQRGMFLTEQNPDFSQQVAAALTAKGLDQDARIITMCRSGSERGRPSAQLLRENGFPNALYVVHGFQGDRAEDGPHAGKRVLNGWQNSGLPWESSLDPAKIFRPKATDRKAWLVILSSGNLETQAMALILASTEIAQGTPIRILLCDDAGLLAVKDETAGEDIVQPVGKSPRQMLQGLIQHGARVEVCGVFLPQRDIEAAALIDGIGVASPASIARAISQPATVTLTY